LQDYLEKLLGCPVDLGTPDSLKPYIRERVMGEFAKRPAYSTSASSLSSFLFPFPWFTCIPASPWRRGDISLYTYPHAFHSPHPARTARAKTCEATRK